MKTLSPLTRYSVGMTVWMALYVAALVGVILYLQAYKPEGPLLYTLAVLPSLPIGGSIWVVLRYMEESDEFIRAFMTRRFILATGLTLFGCTFWGFAENFASVPHLPLYLVYPAFWMSFAIVSLFTRGKG